MLELARELGVEHQVHLLGYRRDIPLLLASSDVFCFPSYREGLSASVMEAMASGVPCMVSRIRGNTDLVDEKGGILFSPDDAVECLEALRKILKADRMSMGEHNLKKIQGFSKEAVLEKMKKIYSMDGI